MRDRTRLGDQAERPARHSGARVAFCCQEVRVWGVMDRAAASARAAPRDDATMWSHRRVGSTVRRQQRRAPESPPHRPPCSVWPPADTARSRKTGSAASRVPRRPSDQAQAHERVTMPRRPSAIPPPRQPGNPTGRTGDADASCRNNARHRWTLQPTRCHIRVIANRICHVFDTDPAESSEPPGCVPGEDEPRVVPRSRPVPPRALR